MNPRMILTGTAAIAGLTFAAGCGAASTGSAASAARAATSIGSAAVPAVPAAPGSGSGGSSSTGLSVDSSSGDIVVGSPSGDVARSVTASYTVPVGSFLASFDTVISDAVALGGYVVGSETSPDAEGRIVSGQVTLAVPTAQLAGLLNILPSDFTASSIDFSSVDDTAGIVDVTARLTSAQAHLTALQALLAKATSLDDITTLEQQIEDVETSIDTDQSQLTTLDQAVSYATATVKLRERGAVTVARVATGPSVSGGASKGWHNVLVILTVAVEVLITAIPAAVLLLIGWLLWFFVRRRHAPRAQTTA
jgi:hypothetical protein